MSGMVKRVGQSGGRGWARFTHLGPVILLALVVGLGCKSDPPAETEPEPSASTEPSCRPQAEAASKWLMALIAEGDGATYHRPDGFQGVMRDAPPEWGGPGSRITVDPSMVHLDGTIVGAASEELAHLMGAKLQHFYQLHGGPRPVWVHLDVDRRSRWEQVTKAWTALAEAGVTGIILVFDAKSTISPPPKSKQHEELVGLREADAQLVGVNLDPTVKQSPLRKCRKVVSIDPKGDDRTNLERLAKALPKCRCSTDLGAVRDAFWLQLSRDRFPPRNFVKVPLPTPQGPPPKPLRLAKDVPWSEAHAKVLEAGTGDVPVTLAVSP